MRRGRRSCTTRSIGRRPSAPIESASSKRWDAEDVEPRQAGAGALQVARIVDAAGHQPGHPCEPFGIEPLGAANADRAVTGERARRDRDRGLYLIGGMDGFDAAVRDLRLGVAVMAPGLHGEAFGTQNRAGAGILADREAALARVVDLVLAVRWQRRRRVDDVGAGEAEERAGVDGDQHRGRGRQGRIGREIGRLATLHADGDGAAIMRFRIEGGEDAAVVAARLGDQTRNARGRIGAVGPEAGSLTQPVGYILIAGDDELDLIELRFADEVIHLLGPVAAEETETENLEGMGRGRCKPQRGAQQTGRDEGG
jgi:hypothetical protein